MHDRTAARKAAFSVAVLYAPAQGHERAQIGPMPAASPSPFRARTASGTLRIRVGTGSTAVSGTGPR